MYIPEDSLKQLIVEIVKDLAARVEKKDFNDLIEQYLNLESTETGLASFIIDIINNNMSSINLDVVLDYINEQIRNSANNISNPFDKAYWKDTLNDNVYLVEIKEGKMNIVDVNDQNSEETT